MLLHWTLPSISHITYFHISKVHMTLIIKKVNRIPTHCGVAYESVPSLARGHVIRVWTIVKKTSVNKTLLWQNTLNKKQKFSKLELMILVCYINSACTKVFMIICLKNNYLVPHDQCAIYRNTPFVTMSGTRRNVNKFINCQSSDHQNRHNSLLYFSNTSKRHIDSGKIRKPVRESYHKLFNTMHIRIYKINN